MNFLDLFFLIILLVFFFLGYKRGFLLSLLQLLGIVLVIILIRQFGTVIREGIHQQFGISDTWAIILGYIVIFIIIMILAKIISSVLQKLMALIHLGRSEEHTSELQSRPHLVCRLLLEKKKNYKLHPPCLTFRGLYTCRSSTLLSVLRRPRSIPPRLPLTSPPEPVSAPSVTGGSCVPIA